MKITDEQYQAFYKQLGKNFKISGRVVAYYRNCYWAKYSDKTYAEAITFIRRDAERKLAQIKQSSFPDLKEIIYLLSRSVDGLERSTPTVRKVPKKMKNVLGGIDKMGLNESIIRFGKRMTEEDMKYICEAKVNDEEDLEVLEREEG